ncbi:MAG: hypothetical protein IJ295_00025, partial [Clostridia bacterium]|nr:hypothetical protein [Clostridia bacterium]
MKKKHYAIAMGEEGIDNLQEHEDAYAKQRSYEDYEHGTGVPSYYDEDSYGYNYQDSNPLTDIDYQPGNDESSVFTDNYTGTEDYDPVARDDEEESDNEDF